jgi:hypothetical protein
MEFFSLTKGHANSFVRWSKNRRNFHFIYNSIVHDRTNPFSMYEVKICGLKREMFTQKITRDVITLADIIVCWGEGTGVWKNKLFVYPQ